MNFEQLLIIFFNQYSFIKNKNFAHKFIKNSYLSLQLKKKQLKLGLITFEIKEHKIPNSPFVLFETIDIRFIRQDNTEEDSQKFETRLERLKIKNKFIIISFLFISAVIVIYIFGVAYSQTLEHSYLPFSLKKLILSSIFDAVFESNVIHNWNNFFKNLNNFLADTVLNLSIKNNFLL